MPLGAALALSKHVPAVAPTVAAAAAGAIAVGALDAGTNRFFGASGRGAPATDTAASAAVTAGPSTRANLRGETSELALTAESAAEVEHSAPATSNAAYRTYCRNRLSGPSDVAA